MGCDIHMVVQVRGQDGKWRDAEVERTCTACGGSGRSRGGNQCLWCKGGVAGVYDSRNYAVFAMLAGVRNGYGPPDDSDPLVPMSKPRGLPPDVAAYDRDEDGRLGDHSYSYLTLDEILSYPYWDREAVRRGVVSREQFAEWDARGAKGSPSGYCRSVGGGGVKHVSNEYMRQVIRDDDWPMDYLGIKYSLFTLVEWRETYRELAGEFIESFVPALQKLGAPHDVRIVFGFDS